MRSWFAYIAQHGRPQAGLDHHAQAIRHAPGTPAPECRVSLTREQHQARATFDELERIKRSLLSG